jgi:hypothetical protein
MQANKFQVLELKNLTSDFSLLSGAEKIEVISCEPSAVTFQAPVLSASVGQLISLKGVLQTGITSSTDFTVVGKITVMKAVSEKEQQITVKLNQYDKSSWAYFIGCLESLQSKADRLLSGMKGDE